ncbi:MAG: hypothetical protein ACJAYD_001282, partial [Patiriisocius sp.]
MKNQVLVLSLGLMSLMAFGQRKELRNAEKAIDKSEFTAALTAINSVNAMLATMDSKYKANYYFLKAQAQAGKNNYAAAADSFNDLFEYEKEIEKERYTEDAQPMLNALV